MTNRVAIITGTERRRSHSEEFKAKLVQMALTPGANSSAIARQHGITPSLLFKWKKDHERYHIASRPDAALALPSAGFARVAPELPPSAAGREIFIHCGDDLIVELQGDIDPRQLAIMVRTLRDLSCVR